MAGGAGGPGGPGTPASPSSRGRAPGWGPARAPAAREQSGSFYPSSDCGRHGDPALSSCACLQCLSITLGAGLLSLGLPCSFLAHHSLIGLKWSGGKSCEAFPNFFLSTFSSRQLSLTAASGELGNLWDFTSTHRAYILQKSRFPQSLKQKQSSIKQNLLHTDFLFYILFFLPVPKIVLG